MAYRALMVLRMEPESAGAIAAAFAEHDQSDLPNSIGVIRRTLFRFHDLYFHLVEADEDIMDRLYAARSHPDFIKVNDEVGRYLVPYSADWSELKDSQADVFYSWEATR